MSKKNKIQSVNFVENESEFVGQNPAYVNAPNEVEFHDLKAGTVTPLARTNPAPVEAGEAPPVAENVFSNRRFGNGALWVYTNANAPENPAMQLIVDAERNQIGFVRNEAIAKFICLAVTDSANRIIAALTARAHQGSGIVNAQGNKIKS